MNSRITSIQITRATMAPNCDGVNSSNRCQWKMDQIVFQPWYRPKVKHLMEPHCSIVVTISHGKQSIRITIDLVNQVNWPILKVYPICIPSKWIHQMHHIHKIVRPMAMTSQYFRHQDLQMTQMYGRLHWVHQILCWEVKIDQYFSIALWTKSQRHQTRWGQKAIWHFTT